jgi:AraC-like DNA-binding protein
MLTALDDENHQIRSYKAGADDYMVKPCNFRLLIARSIQLISKHKAALAQQSAETAEAKNAAKAKTAESLPQGTIITSQADKHFLEKIQTIIAQRISDPNFTVDQLAATANMGRTKFFNKTKELTGMSPNKYLQTERMRMAAELLREGELTVAEVSYRVGIQDASYFNKCFKAAYGVVPSKYRLTD